MLDKLDCHVKRLGIFLITAVLIAGMAGCAYTPPSKNLEIRTWYDLNAVRNNLTRNYILMNDLDSTTPGYDELASPTADGGKGWLPIGTAFPGWFTGTFDGQGHQICDLFINRPYECYVGLFGCVNEGGVIKSLGVVNVAATGDDFVGGLVGNNWYGTVSNSYSTGNVTGDEGAAGLVGDNSGTVSNSYSTGNVTGHEKVGSVLGGNSGTVSNCYRMCSVAGVSYAGGLVGYNDQGTLSNCHSMGSVAGVVYAGGLVGYNLVGTVSNSYSTCSVTGGSHLGGLVGRNGWDGDGTVSNSYSTGNVTGSSHVGGLVGSSRGTVTNSYSTGNVTGSSHVGGLLGHNDWYGVVSNSYSTGSVNGYDRVGGLVGRCDATGTVSDSYSICSVSGDVSVGGLVGENNGGVTSCYSTGTVTGNSSVGGLVGENTEGIVTNSFWNVETSGQSTSAGGTGNNTTEMQDIATFTGAGWSIAAIALNETNPAYIWNIVNNVTYPFLSWQQ